MTDSTSAAPAAAQPAAAPVYHYAPIARRGAAFVLDWAIVTAVLFAVVYGVGVAFVLHRADHTKAIDAYTDVASFLVQPLWVLMIWLYCAVLEGGPHEETLGQLAFGMKVIDYAGRPIGYFRASVRILLKILFCLPLLITDDLGGISNFPLGATLLLASLPFVFDCAFALVTPRKQALHDLIVRCLVVKKHA